MMKIYLIQDSDWDWNDDDYPARMIKADSPEDAAIQFCNEVNETEPLDGAGLKIAEINQNHIVLVSKNNDGVFVIEN